MNPPVFNPSLLAQELPSVTSPFLKGRVPLASEMLRDSKYSGVVPTSGYPFAEKPKFNGMARPRFSLLNNW